MGGEIGKNEAKGQQQSLEIKKKQRLVITWDYSLTLITTYFTKKMD